MESTPSFGEELGRLETRSETAGAAKSEAEPSAPGESQDEPGKFQNQQMPGAVPGWLIAAPPVALSGERHTFGVAEWLPAEAPGWDAEAGGSDSASEESVSGPAAAADLGGFAGNPGLEIPGASAMVPAVPAAVGTLAPETVPELSAGETAWRRSGQPEPDSAAAPAPGGPDLDSVAGLARAPERARKAGDGLEVAFALRLQEIAAPVRSPGQMKPAGNFAAGASPAMPETAQAELAAAGPPPETSGEETAPQVATRPEPQPGQEPPVEGQANEAGAARPERGRDQDPRSGTLKTGEPKTAEPRPGKSKPPGGDGQSQSSEQREPSAGPQPPARPGREQPAPGAGFEVRQAAAQPVSLRNAPAARPAQAPAAPAWEPARETSPAPVRDLSLELPAGDTAGGQRGGVQVRFVERGGEVYVAVRSEDRELASTLRGDLNRLAERMENQGYRAEIWRAPEPARAGYQETGGGEPRDQAGGGRNSQGGSRRQGRDRPAWLAALEEEKGEQT